ncbi:hypothetical protein IWW48_003781 [Coemansia sp. RSA 1200]|nr:hypothetical protein IWW48_003781 [Coemansia sp. RSA 1200]
MNFVPLDPPTTRDQIEELAQANADSRYLLVQSMDIAVLEIGANDANSAFVEIESGSQSVYEFADQLSDEVVLQLEMLRQIGFKRILVANLPALQHTPIVKRKSRSLLAATTVSVYNRMLDFKAKEWSQQANLDSFAVIDLGRFLTIAMSPSVTQSLGITNITSFCAGGQWLNLFEDQITFLDFMKYVVSESGAEVSTDCEDPASVFFFDPIHPSERVHRLFGYYAFNLFQQVLSGDKNNNAVNDLLTEDNLLLLISTHGLSKPSPKPASI